MILSPLGPFPRLQNNLERRKREEGRNTEEFLSIFQYPPKDINRVCSYNLWMRWLIYHFFSNSRFRFGLNSFFFEHVKILKRKNKRTEINKEILIHFQQAKQVETTVSRWINPDDGSRYREKFVGQPASCKSSKLWLPVTAVQLARSRRVINSCSMTAAFFSYNDPWNRGELFSR